MQSIRQTALNNFNNVNDPDLLSSEIIIHSIEHKITKKYFMHIKLRINNNLPGFYPTKLTVQSNDYCNIAYINTH